MERVLVLGSCGAGKSVFAARLGAATGLPVVHLDAVYFLPGWIEPDEAQWRAKLAVIVERPRWVIDGNHSGTMLQRLARADTAIVLDLPGLLCMMRVLHRIVSTYGRVRSDMAPGCPEKIDLEFLWFVLTFRKKERPKIFERLRFFRGDVVVLRTPREIDAFLQTMCVAASPRSA